MRKTIIESCGSFQAENTAGDGKVFFESLENKEGNVHLVRIIAVGQGSSAYWDNDLLESYGSTVFDKGTAIHANHFDAPGVEVEGVRSVWNVVGKVIESPKFIRDDGLYAPVRISQKFNEHIKDVCDIIGLSVRVDADVDDAGNLTALFKTPFTSVDVVSVPGANGRFINKSESFKEEEVMDEATMKALVTSLVAGLKEELTPLLKKAEEVTNEITSDTLVQATESALEAGLSSTARLRVRESVLAGVSVEDAINTEKAYIEELKKSLSTVEEDAGETLGGSGQKADLATEFSNIMKGII